MMIRGYEIGAKLIATIVGVILLIGAAGLFVKSCDNRRNKAAQARVEASQAGAASNSAKDAIGTVARSGEAAAASEEQSRNAERDIRAADGADQTVKPPARDAGIQALCRRPTYANDPRCRRP